MKWLPIGWSSSFIPPSHHNFKSASVDKLSWEDDWFVFCFAVNKWHSLIHYLMLTYNFPPPKMKWTCKFCRVEFSTLDEASKHMHREKFASAQCFWCCDLCEVPFVTVQEATSHEANCVGQRVIKPPNNSLWGSSLPVHELKPASDPEVEASVAQPLPGKLKSKVSIHRRNPLRKAKKCRKNPSRKVKLHHGNNEEVWTFLGCKTPLWWVGGVNLFRMKSRIINKTHLWWIFCHVFVCVPKC